MHKLIASIGAIAFALVPGAAMADTPPNDAQIAHIAYTAGIIDIAAAKQALAKSKNKAVRSFAQEMVRDHAAVNDKALALVKQLHVTPQSNPTSSALTAQANKKRAELAKLSGAAFDRAYATNEVAFHQTVNSALADTLIPSAHNGQLKSLLRTGLGLFKEHQAHAEHLSAALK